MRKLLPRSNVDVLVERYPLLLDIDQVKDFVKQVEVLFNGQTFEELMQKNPDVVFSLQKGKNMIPYDEVPTSSS